MVHVMAYGENSLQRKVEIGNGKVWVPVRDWCGKGSVAATVS
jgi:hypothetical protein